MGILSNIEPVNVFSFFEEITKIPHGSGNIDKISRYLIDFAKNRNLKYVTDKIGNVVIYKDATKGYENSDTVIIQGHMDMVCNKKPDSLKDMSKEGLEIYVDEDYIKAIETTLGGDDGIAMAYALAILDSNDISHPSLECVFTVDEEIGLIGATNFDTSLLKGKTMINIDSEEEGVITVSCAGGNRTSCIIPVYREKIEDEFIGINDYKLQYSNYSKCRIDITGLKGGHSGCDIHRGRTSAAVVLGKVLKALYKEQDIRLMSLCAGPADNVIPSSASAQVMISDFGSALKTISDIEIAYKELVSDSDKNIEIILSLDDFSKLYKPHKQLNLDISHLNPINKVHTLKLIEFLDSAPFGIQKMIKGNDDFPETSLNLGIIDTKKDEVIFEFSVRSCVEKEKQVLSKKLHRLSSSIGGTTNVYGDYPGWEYKDDSRLKDISIKVFEDLYGKKPIIEAVHAGLECGIFSSKIKDLDCISIGPDMKGVHTFEEALSIPSTKRTYEFILEILKAIK